MSRPLVAEGAIGPQHILEVGARLGARNLAGPRAFFDVGRESRHFCPDSRRAADLLGLTAIAENVIDSDEPIDPAARILEPVRVGFPTADKSFVVDVIACTDIDQSRPLKHSQSGLQRGLAGIAPFGLALVNAGRQKHLIHRGKVADDIAAIIKLRKTAERRTHEPADRHFAQAASHLSGTRCDSTLQDIVCALIKRSDQRPVGTGPPRQRFEILDVDLECLLVRLFFPALDRLVPYQRQQMLH